MTTVKQNMLVKKRNLQEGELIPLYFDEAFKIMFGNPEHLEVLTVLLSRILKVEYRDIEGRIELSPPSLPNRTIGKKKSTRDVVVTIKSNEQYKLILEVNVKERFYQSIVDRNLCYVSQIAGGGLQEGKNYEDMKITFLINLNTFYVDPEHEKAIDMYHFRNEEGYILSEKIKVLNINLVKCHELWYNKSYKGQFEPYEEDLVLLCAAMMMDQKEEYEKCLKEVRMRPEIKEMMERVSIEMTKDEEMWGRWYNKEEEEKLIRESIIQEERKDATKEEQIKIAREMLSNDLDINLISRCTKLSIEVIENL